MTQQGDQVHSQGTELWTETDKGMRMRFAESPSLVFTNTRSQYIYRVYAANGKWNIKIRDVYRWETHTS